MITKCTSVMLTSSHIYLLNFPFVIANFTKTKYAIIAVCKSIIGEGYSATFTFKQFIHIVIIEMHFSNSSIINAQKALPQ